ncbi:hypothetical protein [Actinotalea subterranea]|uniref:hypothetical protein n=1 Tax=Actinotalea subterranea TaxID=2607497 RepID=UPI0011EE0966|nr:hypothetical protein [Actinotalea subterranea]
MPDGSDQDWRERRSEAATAHAAALERRRSGEAAQARALLAQFIRDAQEQGLAPVPLRARTYDGRARYRTPLTGWYLRRNESVAVGTDGEFYILSVPPTLRGRLTGATVEPSDPPLVLGKGARDGESIDLVDALRLVLERADS